MSLRNPSTKVGHGGRCWPKDDIGREHCSDVLHYFEVVEDHLSFPWVLVREKYIPDLDDHVFRCNVTFFEAHFSFKLSSEFEWTEEELVRSAREAQRAEEEQRNWSTAGGDPMHTKWYRIMRAALATIERFPKE